jgi:hypothetical protein
LIKIVVESTRQANMKKILITGMVMAITGMVLSGCYNDKYEDLYGGGNAGACDTANVTFSQTILPILNQHCALATCHKTGSAGGGYMLDTYAGAKLAEGRIVGAVNHSTGFSAMPKNGGMLPECERTKIAIWVSQGAPDN